MFMKNVNIARLVVNIMCLVFSILCLLFGILFIFNGVNPYQPVNGIPLAIVGGFLFLSGTLGLLVQICIYNKKN